jgi:hypothetical protein
MTDKRAAMASAPNSTPRMTDAMPWMPVWPARARLAVSAASPVTSFIVLSNSRAVVEISVAAAEIWVVDDPRSLTTFEKKSLKDAFRLISRVQDLMVEQYGVGMVGS